jgi:hypothetical protein
VVTNGFIRTPAGGVILTGTASATLKKNGGYQINSQCSTFGISNTTFRPGPGRIEWLELGDVEADFTGENRGRGRLVTTKPTAKKPSTALVKTVTGYPSFKIYIRTYKPPKPAAGAGTADEDDDYVAADDSDESDEDDDVEDDISDNELRDLGVDNAKHEEGAK